MVEAGGKIYLAKDEPDPMQCPDCRKIQPAQKGKGTTKIRCLNCRWQGTIDEFKAHFIEIGTARVVVAV